MTALAFEFDFGDTLERAPSQKRRLVAVRGTVDAPAGVQTLDSVLSGAWTALAAGRVAACPVCSSAVLPRWSAGTGVIGTRCDDCGSSLD